MKKLRIKIEIPRGSRVKYEINKETGEIEVDRVMDRPLPYHYGFIPKTLWDDGDALDVILWGEFELHPNVVAEVYPIGLIEMYDNGQSDFKIVCSVTRDVKFYTPNYFSTLDFLRNYKPGVSIVDDSGDQSRIWNAIDKAESNYWASTISRVETTYVK